MTENANNANIGQWLAWGKDVLAGSESAAVDTRVLLCECLHCSASYLLTWPDKVLSAAEARQFQRLICQRKEGIPVAYILGYRDFWSLRLRVSPATLIPRPETELLVELALGLPLADDSAVLDLGTGTGAIALALASERPNWRLTGVDKQSAAVSLAQQNAQENNLAQVKFICGDWFSPLPPQRYQLIVSNPPYVEQDSPWLQQGDVRFEPASALTAGDDGLDDIRYIASQVEHFLQPGGWLLLEHGYNQGAAIRQILSEQGLQHISTHQDLAALDRVSIGQWLGI